MNTDKENHDPASAFIAFSKRIFCGPELTAEEGENLLRQLGFLLRSVCRSQRQRLIRQRRVEKIARRLKKYAKKEPQTYALPLVSAAIKLAENQERLRDAFGLLEFSLSNDLSRIEKKQRYPLVRAIIEGMYFVAELVAQDSREQAAAIKMLEKTIFESSISKQEHIKRASIELLAEVAKIGGYIAVPFYDRLKVLARAGGYLNEEDGEKGPLIISMDRDTSLVFVNTTSVFIIAYQSLAKGIVDHPQRLAAYLDILRGPSTALRHWGFDNLLRDLKKMPNGKKKQGIITQALSYARKEPKTSYAASLEEMIPTTPPASVGKYADYSLRPK